MGSELDLSMLVMLMKSISDRDKEKGGWNINKHGEFHFGNTTLFNKQELDFFKANGINVDEVENDFMISN